MTDTQQPPKIKFKKRNIKKKQLRGNNKSVDDSAAAVETNAKIKSNDDVIKEDINNHDEEEEEEEGALNTILAVERRRKLLNNRNRGVDSAILLKASKLTTTTDNNKTTITTVDNNKDLEERLKGTFSAGKLAGSNDMGGDDEGGILAKKHKLAMEEFIQSNLQQSGGTGKTTTESSSNGEATSSSAIINNGGPITEDEKELFAELLSTSDLNTNNHQANNNASQSKLEGDVGAGGAMMMGSGIAEVALPISERLKTQKATEKAAMEYEKAQASRRRAPTGSRHDGGNDDYDDQFPTAGGSTGNDVNVAVVHDLPMNFASGPGKRKRQEDVNVVSATTTTTTTSPKKNVAPSQKEQSIVSSSSAAYYSASSAGGSVQRSDVSTLGQSYSHNFQLHQQDWIAQRRDERQSEIDTLKIKQHADEAQDLATTGGGKERMGFEMARRAAKGEKNVRPSVPRGPNGESLMNEWDRKKGGTHNQRSNDDRVWKQFMQKNKR